MNADVWRLTLLPGNRWMALIPHDLAYFNKNFIGKPLPENWSAPTYKRDGTKKRVPDFMSWMSGTPLVKERVADSIAALAGSRVQFPFFDTIKGEKIFALNVLALASNALDLDRSDISRGEGGELIRVRKAVFQSSAVSDLPPIFKLAIAPNGDIYVTRSFCDMVVREKYKGVGFADPAVDPLFLAIRGPKVNVFPGVEE